ESYYPCHGVLLLTTCVWISGRYSKAEWDDSSARKGGSYEGVCVGPAGSSTAPTRPATIISRAADSPIMMVGALVLADGIVGMTEASAMRRPWTPQTRSSASTTASSPDPMAQVPTGWR